MIKYLEKINRILNKKEKFQFFTLTILTLSIGFLETLSVSIFIPLIEFFSNDKIDDSINLNQYLPINLSFFKSVEIKAFIFLILAIFILKNFIIFFIKFFSGYYIKSIQKRLGKKFLDNFFKFDFRSNKIFY